MVMYSFSQTAVSEVVNMSQLISDNAREFVYKDANGRDQYVLLQCQACIEIVIVVITAAESMSVTVRLPSLHCCTTMRVYALHEQRCAFASIPAHHNQVDNMHFV